MSALGKLVFQICPPRTVARNSIGANLSKRCDISIVVALCRGSLAISPRIESLELGTKDLEPSIENQQYRGYRRLGGESNREM